MKLYSLAIRYQSIENFGMLLRFLNGKFSEVMNSIFLIFNRLLTFVASCLSMAIKNLMLHKARTFTAALGIVFAVFLMFLQIGFLQAVKKEATLLYEYFSFDLAVISPEYQFLYSPPSFDRIRLIQAKSLPDVTDTFNLNINIGGWIDPETELRSSMLMIGVDRKDHFIKEQKITSGLNNMAGRNSVLLDEFSHSDFGHRKVGANGVINRRNTTVVGLFQLGLFFYAEGAIIVDNQYFHSYARKSSRQTSIGLIQLKKGTDLTLAKKQLAMVLPEDVKVISKSELINQEQRYFVSIKPLGIIFNAGVFIALVIGIVILFQVLSTEINNRMREFATLKAIGFGNSFVYGIGVVQTMIFAIIGFIPAMILCSQVFNVIYDLSHLPTKVNLSLVSDVIILVIAMSFFSALITLQKIRRANPAELF